MQPINRCFRNLRQQAFMQSASAPDIYIYVTVALAHHLGGDDVYGSRKIHRFRMCARHLPMADGPSQIHSAGFIPEEARVSISRTLASIGDLRGASQEPSGQKERPCGQLHFCKRSGAVSDAGRQRPHHEYFSVA